MSKPQFTKTPDLLALDSDLSDGAFRTYIVLAGCARQFKTATFEMTLDQLGTLIGRSRDQAERRVRELQRHGLVAVHGRQDRRRPNRITVLDPQDVVFAGLHVERDAAETPHPDAADLRHHDTADLRHPYIEGRETREGGEKRDQASPPPVDNGGALRRPRPPEASECGQHRGQPAHNCGPCRSERIASTGPPF